MSIIISLVIAYLLGSISSATLLSLIMKFPDPREEGSGNAGATNVLRTAGKNKAAMVLVGDMIKGLIAILIARMIGLSGALLGFVAVFAVIGHMFPVFFKFKGGKGVATAIGCLLGLSPLVAIISAAAWIGVAYVSKYASLASLVCIYLAFILLLVFGQSSYAFPMLLTAFLITWKHKANIERLKNGTESKITF